MIRVWFVALLTAALVGCSSSGELKPEPLVDVKNSIKFDRQWSRDIGDAQDRRYALLRPAYANGRIYTMDIDGKVSAYDLETGKKYWRSRLKADGVGAVGANQNTVVVGTYEGEIIALDAASGDELWRQTVSTEVLSAPQPNSDAVVVHTIDGKLHGLDVRTGDKLWQYDNTHPVLSLRGSSTPIVTDAVAISAFDNGKVIALNPDNGLPIWDQRVAIPKGRTDLERVVDIDGSPLLVGDLVFAASYQGRLVSYLRASGRPIWTRDVSTARNLASNGLAVFVTTDEDAILAYNLANGEDLWQNEQMLRRKLTGPAVVSGYVVAADDDGYLHVLDAESGEYLGRKKIDGSGVRAPLKIIGDKLLVIDNDGDLSVYTLSAKP